ncbi:hypothetical protein [Flavobacterium sp. KMS]|uniref:hypothetical protein n=1 Tax=Flavobacterium sp. KMS TaxID=1566023 RepID=UPI0006899062|nr:hypothetical protein [Flavobacterium sp. KMS]
MECRIYIENELIGKATFEIIDRSMGVISGKLICNDNYRKFQKTIQKQTDEIGISNSDNFNYRIITINNVEIKAEGGIGISDSAQFKEIIIESAGINLDSL